MVNERHETKIKRTPIAPSGVDVPKGDSYPTLRESNKTICDKSDARQKLLDCARATSIS